MTESLYLYRVLENDDEGDPLDFGVVRAPDVSEAATLVTRRLSDVLGEGEYDVRLYPLIDLPGPRVLHSNEFTDRILVVAEET
jgi:hypothetical protein